MEQVSLRIRDLVQKSQIVAGAPVCHGGYISGKPYGSIAVVALPDGGTHRILSGDVRRGLRELYAGFLRKPVHIRIFSQNLQSFALDVGSASAGQQISYIIEVIVAGVPDGGGHIFVSMPPQLPASGSGRNFPKGSHTVELFVQSDDSLHKSCGGNQHLESGARRRRVLGGVIVLRIGLVGVQFCKVFRIDGVGHLIIVISRIGHHGQNISRIYVRDHHGGIARIQRQLGRSDVQVVDAVLHELIGSDVPCKYGFLLLLRHRNLSLLA